MKNEIKKADMQGQFIDMQPTRGGIPPRLYNSGLRRCDIERIGVPYVVGRMGWHKGRRPTPDDRIFVHYTDKQKVNDYYDCLSVIRDFSRHIIKQGGRYMFQENVKKYGFKFPKSMQKTVKELMS